MSRQLTSSRYFNDVAYDGTRFCAFGSSGAVASSTNGIAWANRTAVPSYYGGYAVSEAVARGASLFVAVGYEIMTSPDCVTWTQRQVPWDSATWWYYFYDVAYGAGIHVAVGYRGVNGAEVPLIVTSTDGVNWAVRDVGLPPGIQLETVGYGDGRFVVIGESSDDGTPILLTSEDGLDWTQHPAGFFGLWPICSDIAYLDGTFVALLDVPWTSPDGISWSQADTTGLPWGAAPSAWLAAVERSQIHRCAWPPRPPPRPAVRPCCPGAKLRFSKAHLGVKQRSPFS